MRVLVDTPIWSLALRRQAGVDLAADQKTAATILADLVRDGRAELMGAVRQELLSGIKLQKQFDTLKRALAAFDDIPLTTHDYELAAQFFNTCRAKGVQGSNTDFLICAVSVNHQMPILSLDRDFESYRKHLPIQFFSH